MRSRLLFAAVLGLGLAGGVTRPAVADTAAVPGVGLPQWTVLYGGFRHLDDIAPTGPDTAWGVNALQTAGGLKQTAFARLEDGVWRVVQTLDGRQATAIAFAGPELGFAVGDGGGIWRWNGAAWLPMASPVTRNLTDVSLSSPTEGWASGDAGTLIRWNGRDWQRYPLPITISVPAISSVVSLSAEEAWATSLGGAILRFDGSWQPVTTPAIQRPVQIAFAGPGHALVVGRGVLELKDGAWRSVGETTSSYRSVAWVGRTAYVVGNDKLLAYGDGGWSPVALTGPGNLAEKRFEHVIAGGGGAWAIASDGTLASLAAGRASYLWPPARVLRALDRRDTLLWSGGEAVTAGFVGQRDGGWLSQAEPGEGGTVWDLALVGATDGWALSSDPSFPGAMAMWRWDGARWRSWPVDKTWLLTRVQMLGPDEGWASGGNVIARWQGASWEQVPGVPLGAAGPLSMLRGGDDPLGWFGSYGSIFRLAGEAFTAQPVPDTSGVLAIDMLAPDEGFAITPNSVLRYDGEAWAHLPVPKPAGSFLRDLDAQSPDSAWVLLDPPALLHWTGQTWDRHDLGPLGGEASFFRLQASALVTEPVQTDIWLAGAPPTLARYRVVTPTARLYLPAAERPQ